MSTPLKYSDAGPRVAFGGACGPSHVAATSSPFAAHVVRPSRVAVKFASHSIRHDATIGSAFVQFPTSPWSGRAEASHGSA